MASVNDEIVFDTGDWSSSYTYRVFSVTGNVVELRLFQIGGTWWHNPHAIQFDTSTGIWSDTSTVEVPNVFSSTLNGTRTTSVSGYPTSLFGFASLTSTSHYWEITTPSWAQQSSGGGTGTEGSSTPSGSTYINSQNQIVFVIDSTSPSSDATIVYKIFRRPVGGILQQAYVVPHTSGGSGPTEWTIGLNYSLYDRWELRVESSTGLVQSGVLAVYTTVKKVFRNFW